MGGGGDEYGKSGHLYISILVHLYISWMCEPDDYVQMKNLTSKDIKVFKSMISRSICL